MFNFLQRVAEKLKADRANKARLTNDESWLDVQWPVNARQTRRVAEQKARRQQRKGQRTYDRQQRKLAFRRDTLLAQQHVLKTLSPDHPMHQNVRRSVEWQQAKTRGALNDA